MIVFILGLFFLVDLYGYAPKGLKNIIIGIVTIGLVFHLILRSFSWNLNVYQDKIGLNRVFDSKSVDTKTINFSEIKEVGLLQGFRMNTSLTIETRSGKKYNVLLDKKTTEIAKIIHFLKESGVKIGLYCGNHYRKKLENLVEKTA